MSSYANQIKINIVESNVRLLGKKKEVITDRFGCLYGPGFVICGRVLAPVAWDQGLELRVLHGKWLSQPHSSLENMETISSVYSKRQSLGMGATQLINALDSQRYKKQNKQKTSWVS